MGLKTFPEQDYFILHRRDKGGKTRLSPIVGPHIDAVVRRMKATPPSEKVWQYVSSNCDVHGYRADYATFLYKQYARPIEQLDYHKKIRCSDGKYRSKFIFIAAVSAENGSTAVRSASSASRSATVARTPRLQIIFVIFRQRLGLDTVQSFRSGYIICVGVYVRRTFT